MSHYQTKQRKLLLEFMQEDPQKSYTAEELAEALQHKYGEQAPGKSTIYRLLPRLTEEGIIRRFEQEGTHCNRYQFTDHACHHHLHLQCSDCGKLIHMNDQASAHLLEQISEGFDFWVDGQKAVLFGRCRGCRKELS